MKDQKQFLGGLSPEEFSKKYWNQKPFVIKGAYPKAIDLAEPGDFFEICSEENFETRAIWKKKSDKDWVVKDGPFEKKEFSKKDLWTLVVHSLDIHFPEFKELKELVDFIPQWQFDDIMATFSNEGSSVGAHIDNYSAFILQANGRRKWTVQLKPDPSYIEDIDIKLLKNFNPDEEYILEPGDMIYIPPGVAHHGESLDDDCISYSLGFKAFEYQDMAASFFQQVLLNLKDDKALRGQINLNIKDPYCLDEETLESVEKIFKEEILKKDKLRQWLGFYLTRPRQVIEAEEELSKEQVLLRLEDHLLYKDPFVRFNWTKLEDDLIELYIAQEIYLVSEEVYKELYPLLTHESYEEIEIKNKPLSEEAWRVLLHLIKNGFYYFTAS